MTAAKVGNVGRQVLVLLLLWACYQYLLWLSLTYFPESDSASPLLAAEDLLHGNWMLRGWWLPTDTFWLTEMPLYAAGLALRRLTPFLMHEIPTVIYLGVLVIVAVAVLSPFAPGSAVRPRTKGIAITAALLPLLLPSEMLGTYTLLGPAHIATIGFVLGSFVTIHNALVQGRGPGFTRLIVAAAAIMGAAVTSDPLALWIGVVPAILASFVLVWRSPARWRGPAVVPAAVAMTGWLVAKIMLTILRLLNGFTPVGQGATFVDFVRLGANISLFVKGTLELFGANFFGLPASVGTLPVLLRLLGCLAVMASIGFTWRNAREHDDQLSLLLSLATIVTAGAFIFSAVPRGASSARFLIPLVVLGSVLLGRRARRIELPTAPKTKLIVVVLGLAVTGLYAVAPITRLRHPGAAVDGLIGADHDWLAVTVLGPWLAANGLQAGYGPYWAASIVTVATRGAVTVRPVTADHPWVSPEDEIRVMEWYAKCSWYREPAARFVVARENQENLNLRTVTFTFGRPTAIHAVAGYTVFEWDHPIRLKPAVAHASPRKRWVFHRLANITPRFRPLQSFVEPRCY